jgi:hypothetical protein
METQITKEFIDFLIEAKKNGYASGDSKKTEKDGSKTITFSKGRYSYNDNYFGGEPYGGREVVFIDGKAFWMMVYYGAVIEGDVKKIYPFLQKALRTIKDEAPYRGDIKFEEDEYKYTNIYSGNVNSFSGLEMIFYKGKVIYEANYRGGLVDQ